MEAGSCVLSESVFPEFFHCARINLLYTTHHSTPFSFAVSVFSP